MSKTLFNSSEKSNFILNMTEEKYSSIASKVLMAMCLMVSLFTIPAECIESIGFPIISAGLAISGVVCLILALIAIIKKFVDKKMLFPVCAFGVMLLWGIISLINSYSVTISFYGSDGRGEGLLALIFYFGFFITGLTIKHEKALLTFIGGIIGTGILNSVWALIQIFIGKPSNFKYVSTDIQINAASGLSQSPIFLAMLLTLSLTAAIICSIMSQSKRNRIICIICSCLFSFVMMFTYSLVGICGIAFAVIASIITAFIAKAPKIRLLGILSIILPAVASVILASSGIVGAANSYRLYDGRIMWWDSYMRLSTSGIYNHDAVDADDTIDVYSFLNEKTLNIIQKYPLTGTGPEQLVYPQLYSSSKIDENIGTFDKNYNEYLYTASTRGVPSLIALIAVLASTLIISLKKLRKNTKSSSEVTFFFLLIGGIALFFIGCSNISFSPIFWAAAGASCSVMIPNSSAKKINKQVTKSETK